LTSATFVLAIAGHSGAGKSTVIAHLCARLGHANALSLDNYEASSHYPPASQWIQGGADPNEFLSPQYDADVRALKNGRFIIHPESIQALNPGRFLLLEEPFGRGRTTLRDLIDFAVYVDTPLEISYIRKISRKNTFLPWEDDPHVFIAHLRENMEWYLRVGRTFYLVVAERVREDCDLIVDGTLSTEQIADKIMEAIYKK